ncbi:hypothetical protein ACIQWV_24195 [Streptomyces sp. NPDC098085]|uniref:hypothetical protein n=1 Tax=Streptomyces sp. NPDC098085 TaxID=3366094 RepID=UPI00382A24F7
MLGEVGEVEAVVGGGGEEFVSQDAIDADVSMLMFNVFGRRFLAGPLSWTRPGSAASGRRLRRSRSCAIRSACPSARSSAAS